jgi:hypothetical protein
MLANLLRRLGGRSTSTSSDDEGAHGGQRPTTERQVRAGRGREPLPAAWLRMHVWWRNQGRCVVCGEREGVWFDYIVSVRKRGSGVAPKIASDSKLQTLNQNYKRLQKGREALPKKSEGGWRWLYSCITDSAG